MKYIVKTIALAVKNNRIAKFGEEVDETELTVTPSELIETGAIEAVVVKTKSFAKKVEVVADAEKDKYEEVYETEIETEVNPDEVLSFKKLKAETAAEKVAKSTQTK